MDFARTVRIMRAVRNVTQAELSETLGLPRATIIAVESGWIPPEELRVRILGALGWTLATGDALEVLDREE